jgi:hypothetical protein
MTESSTYVFPMFFGSLVLMPRRASGSRGGRRAVRTGAIDVDTASKVGVSHDE